MATTVKPTQLSSFYKTRGQKYATESNLTRAYRGMLQTAIDDKVRDMQFYRDEIQRLQELRNDILEDAADLRLKGEVAAQDAREFNQRAQNSALRSATSINASNERFNAKQKALAAYYGSQFYSTRGRGALALDPNNQALAQRTFQGMSADPVRGFQALQADIDATQGVDKTAQGKGKTYDYMLSQYAGALLDAGDPRLALATDPAAKQEMARNIVKQQLPQSVQDQIDSAQAARASAAKTSGTVGGEAAAVGGVKVPFGTISPEEAQQPFELAATQMEERLEGLSAEEQQARRSMELLAEQDPYFRAREQYRQTYFPGTQTPARVNEAMRQFLLLSPEEQAPVLEAFRARMQADRFAGRMPAETPLGGEVDDLAALRMVSGKEGPRMPGDVIYGKGSPFVPTDGPIGSVEAKLAKAERDMAQYELSSSVYDSLSQRVKDNLGLEVGELSQEQLNRLNAEGGDVVGGRVVPLVFSEQIARDEEARLPTDMEAPPTLREREQDISMEQGVEAFRALQQRRAEFPALKQAAVSEQLDAAVRGRDVVEKAVAANALTQEKLNLALSDLSRAEYQGLDPKDIAVLRGNVEAARLEDERAGQALDEALALTSIAETQVGKFAAAELPEDVEARKVAKEVREAERPPQMLGEAKPFSTMLDKAELRKMDEPVSIQDKDKRAKSQAIVEASKLVKDKKLNTSSPLGQAIDEFYQANKAGGFAMPLKDQISYITKEFPDPKRANEAVTTLYGLYIQDENAKYLEPVTDLTTPPTVEEVPVQEGTLPTQEEAVEQ